MFIACGGEQGRATGRPPRPAVAGRLAGRPEGSKPANSAGRPAGEPPAAGRFRPAGSLRPAAENGRPEDPPADSGRPRPAGAQPWRRAHGILIYLLIGVGGGAVCVAKSNPARCFPASLDVFRKFLNSWASQSSRVNIVDLSRIKAHLTLILIDHLHVLWLFIFSNNPSVLTSVCHLVAAIRPEQQWKEIRDYCMLQRNIIFAPQMARQQPRWKLFANFVLKPDALMTYGIFEIQARLCGLRRLSDRAHLCRLPGPPGTTIPENLAKELKVTTTMTTIDPLSRIEIVHGDIIKQKGDFVVNAANPAMMGGAGIDKTIHDAAGPQLDAFEDGLRRKYRGEPCPTGEAVLTPAFNLKKRFAGIIHTAGPRLFPNARPQPEDAMLLRSCYRKSLEIVAQEGKSSVVSLNWYSRCLQVFPLISSGFFYYPVELSGPIILHEIASFLHSHKEIKRVVLCSTDKQQVDVMKCEMNRLREPPSPPPSSLMGTSGQRHWDHYFKKYSDEGAY